MSQMKNRTYEPIVGFDLWITRSSQEGENKTSRLTLATEMILPISKKTYKVTLKNVKTYVQELHELDPTILNIHIYRISAVGVYNFEEKKNG